MNDKDATVYMRDIEHRAQPEVEPTIEERAINALNLLATTYPDAEDVVRGVADVPEWMGQPWLPQLTDPSDPKFADAVIKAEAWLATH